MDKHVTNVVLPVADGQDSGGIFKDVGKFAFREEPGRPDILRLAAMNIYKSSRCPSVVREAEP